MRDNIDWITNSQNRAFYPILDSIIVHVWYTSQGVQYTVYVKGEPRLIKPCKYKMLI